MITSLSKCHGGEDEEPFDCTKYWHNNTSENRLGKPQKKPATKRGGGKALVALVAGASLTYS